MAVSKKPGKIRQTAGEKVFDLVVMLLLVIMMLFFIYPFYNCVVLSLNDGQDALQPGIYFWPRMFTLENYEKAVQAPGFGAAALISVLRTVAGTVLTVMVTAMFGYAMSKKRLRFRSFYLIVATIPMFFSGGMVPSFLLIKGMGLYNNFLVYILPGMFSMFYAIIFMGSFRELPDSLEESAMLDGANQLVIFFRIILPVSMPVIAAISIFTAVGHWNSWMDTMLYTDKKTLNTLAYLFSKVIFQTQYLQGLMDNAEGAAAEIGAKMRGVTSTSVMVATMVLATVPITIVYPFFQKHFAKGVMIGSVKG